MTKTVIIDTIGDCGRWHTGLQNTSIRSYSLTYVVEVVYRLRKPSLQTSFFFFSTCFFLIHVSRIVNGRLELYQFKHSGHTCAQNTDVLNRITTYSYLQYVYNEINTLIILISLITEIQKYEVLWNTSDVDSGVSRERGGELRCYNFPEVTLKF